MKLEMLRRVMESPRLPSLPAIALEVIDLVQQPDVTIKQIAQTIQNDPALSARILKTVNSSFYGQSYSVSTITHALVVLGLNSVKTLALGFSLVGNLRTGGGERFDHMTFWKRSLYSATAARHLADRLSAVQAEEAFLGGLMQDLGMLALSQVLGEEYHRILAAAGTDHARLAPMEQELLGVDHASIGGLLAEAWKLPPLLVAPIRHHETPDEAKGDVAPVVRCVAAGNRVADVFMSDRPGDALAACHQALKRWFGLDEAEAEPLLHAIHQSAAETRRLFDLPTGELGHSDEILARANEALLQISLQTQQQTSQLQRQNRKLSEQAVTDSLTGVANRRRFAEVMEEQFAAAKGRDWPLSVLFIDADRFKQLNDTHGHLMGDRVLVALARLLVESMPPGSLVARYGGEEFAVVLPQSDRRTAARLAEYARQKVEALAIETVEGVKLAASVSIGVATFEKGVFERVDQLIGAADQGVYAAKAAGRNCVRIHAPRLQNDAA